MLFRISEAKETLDLSVSSFTREQIEHGNSPFKK